MHRGLFRRHAAKEISRIQRLQVFWEVDYKTRKRSTQRVAECCKKRHSSWCLHFAGNVTLSKYTSGVSDVARSEKPDQISLNKSETYRLQSLISYYREMIVFLLPISTLLKISEQILKKYQAIKYNKIKYLVAIITILVNLLNKVRIKIFSWYIYTLYTPHITYIYIIILNHNFILFHRPICFIGRPLKYTYVNHVSLNIYQNYHGCY